MDLRYQLSRIIPMPMSTNYGLVQDDGSHAQYHTSWWQWRGRIYNHIIEENNG